MLLKIAPLRRIFFVSASPLTANNRVLSNYVGFSSTPAGIHHE